jgi:hypothetical protein
MKKRMNSKMIVMSICVSLYIGCVVAVLFSGTLVLSRPASEEGLSVKLESLEQTARYWVGQENKKNAPEKEHQEP